MKDKLSVESEEHSWPQGVHVSDDSLSQCTAIVQGNKDGEVCPGSLHYGGQMRPDWDVDDLFHNSLFTLPPSLPRLSAASSSSFWSCDSHFSSLPIQDLVRLQRTEQTVSIWRRCCVARTTTSDEGTIWGGWGYSAGHHSSDMIGCYGTKPQACVSVCMWEYVAWNSWQWYSYIRCHKKRRKPTNLSDTILPLTELILMVQKKNKNTTAPI